MSTELSVGLWSLKERLGGELTLEALDRALEVRQPGPGLLHHSDRGSQYTADDYQTRLRSQGFEVSMSRRGDCWDNAPLESFFATLKKELLRDADLATKRIVRTVIFDYIEGFYNRRRLHSALGYQSPTQYEELMVESRYLMQTLRAELLGGSVRPAPKTRFQ